MSWHFLERWIEKANHHSTLIGKFWITFLIVCRMVIVASVGDRVYSDEQSEFKCNTLQPGCTNVCFNRFSPISHLRFWSFQILLVATPSVMFIIYSGHDQKGGKGGGKSKKSKKKISDSDPRRQRPKINHPGGVGEMKITRNNNANNNNNNSNSCDNRNKKTDTRNSPKRNVTNRDVERDKVESGNRFGRGKGQRDSPTRNGDIGSRSQTPQVMATLINYKNGGVGTPIETSVVDERNRKKESNVPWSEMRWNSLMHVAENATRNNNDEAVSRNMWKKPKESSRTQRKDVADGYDNKPNINAEMIMWGPPSSDDDNRNGKYRKTNQGSLVEADMYQNGMAVEAVPNVFDKEHQIALIGTHPPPEYPGYEWPQTDLDGKCYNGKTSRNKGFGLPEYEFVKTRTKKARFTRHFNLYFASVFARLALEIAFLVMQILLYGFTVPALFKCEQWPCPNKVDCFISRPMEKTIFLYFMLVYTCICVLLNAFELKYLTWVYLFGRPKLRAKQKKSDEETGNIIYDANGEPKYTTRFLDQDSEFDECELAEIEEDDEYLAMQNGYGFGNRFGRYAYEDARERGRRNLYARGGRGGRSRDRYQDKMADMRRHELDLILNDEEMQDDYDMDIAQNDPVEDMIQMEMQSHGGSGGGSA